MWPYVSMGQENNSSLQWTFKLNENIILMPGSSQTAHRMSGALWKGRENKAEDVILLFHKFMVNTEYSSDPPHLHKGIEEGGELQQGATRII